jgi:uncharacterized membrane protein
VKPGLTATLVRSVRWVVIAVACIGYPILAYLAAADPNPDLWDVAVAITPMSILALVLAWRSPQRPWLLLLWLVAAGGLYRFSGGLLLHFNWAFLLEHAGIQTMLALAFGRSLRAGQVPMVSRFAAIVHGELSAAQVRYTRQVTWAWTLYFAGTSSLSLLLFWLAPVSVWSTFAILLNLPLLIAMFVTEYLVRLWVLPPGDRAGALESIRAYRQAGTGNPPPLA